MKIKICCLLFLFVLFAQYGYSNPKDTIPPTYTWISPEKNSLLTTNTIRLCVDAHDNENGSGIKKVVFYTSYFDGKDRVIPKHFIGEVNSFPYEFVWDCSHIPDQRIGLLNFFCDIIDNAGNVTRIAKNSKDIIGPLIVLDRNPALKDVQLLSHLIDRDIFIDGNLNEWEKKDNKIIFNNDNKIFVYSSWNKKYLFFGIRVEDKSIISNPDPNFKENICKIGLEDIVSIYLDTDHNHSEIISKPDRNFIISPAGMAYELKYYYKEDYIYEVCNPNMNFKVNVHGTLNEEKDIDTDYTIELAISWDELGVHPEYIQSMGLEIWNNDLDYIDGNYFFAGWTTTASNLKNPSEWGNIVFVGGNDVYNKSVVIVCVTICGVVIFLIAKKTKGYRVKSKNSHIAENGFIIKSISYIEEHYSEETLSRAEVARFVGLTPSYFGKLFKKDTGLSFRDYLINIRIEKAKNQLITTNKNISEIAFDVGFKSLSHFGYLFMKNLHISPRKYRFKFKTKKFQNRL